MKAGELLKKKIVIGAIIIMFFGIFIYQFGSQTIKIGFVGELSTTASQLSIESREAFLFAVDEQNKKGGINGKKIIPYLYDDKNDNNYKTILHEQLQKDGIQLIVGFNVSAMVETVEYLMANGDYLIISPTISTDYMSGKDDRFIKISPSSKKQADIMLQVVQSQNLKRLTLIYSESNKLYAKVVSDRMVDLLHKDGREVVLELGVDELDMDDLYEKMMHVKSDGLVVVLDSYDVAKLVQRLRLGGFDGPIMTTAWAATGELLSNSGEYGEGLYAVTVATTNPDEVRRQVLERYIQETTKTTLNFSHMRSYNACNMLFQAMSEGETTRPEAVKEAIIKIGSFRGVEAQFMIDAFGDNGGDYQLEQVKDGKFKKVR